MLNVEVKESDDEFVIAAEVEAIFMLRTGEYFNSPANLLSAYDC
jgi:hypothetical protein